MKKTEFDELQQSRRYRYGYQSFLLLAVLLMTDNVLYGVGIVWAQHPTNTFILLLTSFAYYISRCIWGDAMVGPKETPVRMTGRTMAVILIAAVAAVLTAGYAMMDGNFKPTEGKGDSLLFPYCLAMWAVIGIVFIIKRIRESKTDK